MISVESSPTWEGAGTGQARLAMLPISGDPRTYGGAIDWLLQQSGVTQAELARRLNVKPQTIDQYRSGKKKLMGADLLCRVATACNARLELVSFGKSQP